jgi:hypothetical protein
LKVRAQFCKLQIWCTRLAAASDKVYRLYAHVRWVSPGTAASSTTKTGHYDIAEILLKVALSTRNQSIKSTITLTPHPSIVKIHYHSKRCRVLWVDSQTWKKINWISMEFGHSMENKLLSDRYKICILKFAISSWDSIVGNK